MLAKGRNFNMEVIAAPCPPDPVETMTVWFAKFGSAHFNKLSK
jgi:hypothetical protein